MVLTFVVAATLAAAPGCLCIEGSVARTPCATHRLSAAERAARREIQARIDLTIEADKAKDVDAATRFDTPDYTVKNLDGSVDTLDQARAGIRAGYERIGRVSDDTYVHVDCVTLRGDVATIYVNQHFVRTIRLGDDPALHELITNITHREIWVRTPSGWMQRHIDELQRGPTFIDGKPRLGR
jgi:hypothetical protein